jgi:peptide-methionine (S)-S-oxide reductase
MFFTRAKSTLVEPEQALPGRSSSVLVNPTFHDIFGIPVQKVPEGSEVAYFALGCFWGAEKLFWQTPGVTNTAAGYAGGFTPNPTYEEVCSARTGHTEIVKVSYDPNKVSYAFQTEFARAGYGRITTEIKPEPEFYYAEDYHQQYLDKNPRGYCPVHATGVTCN